MNFRMRCSVLSIVAASSGAGCAGAQRGPETAQTASAADASTSPTPVAQPAPEDAATSPTPVAQPTSADASTTSPASTTQPAPTGIPSACLACRTNADCVLVATPADRCCGGGGAVAVRRGCESRVPPPPADPYAGVDCRQIACDQVERMPPPTSAACVQHQCQGVN